MLAIPKPRNPLPPDLMCAMMTEVACPLVRALERRIERREADYAAANAAWKANRDRWSSLDWDTRGDRAEWRECQAAAQELNALCEKLHKQIRRLRQELWRAEREAAEAAEAAEKKISPPGRPAGAESGRPDDGAFLSQTNPVSGCGLACRSEGNRVGIPECEVVEGRASA